jgi:cytochrome c
LAAAAAFLRRAAELTPDPAVRAGRALEAAHATHEAGASEAALELLGVAATGPLDAVRAARVELLRARIAFHGARGVDGPRMLLDAARSLAPLDAALSRETYLDALDAAIVTGGPGPGGSLEAVADAARPRPRPRRRRGRRTCCSTGW